MRTSFEEYLAIRFDERVSLVGVSPVHPDRLHWFGGFAYTTRTPEIEILKTYRVADFADEDELEIQFWRDFAVFDHELSADCWIAPDGTCYTCPPYVHDSLARKLTAVLYGNMKGTKYLESQGWIRLSEGIGGRVKPPTQAQADTIFQIVQATDDPGDKRHLERTLRSVLSEI